MMRLLLLSFICLSLNTLAQKMPLDYFEEAQTQLNTGYYAEAIPLLKHIVDHCPKFDQYTEAHYGLGVAYYGNKQYQEGITVFREILNKDSIETIDYNGDIMENPYSNFKNGAAYMISKSYFGMKQYDSAMFYLELSERVHTYQHFCGNAITQNEIHDQIYKAEIYKALGEKNNYESTLLKYTFLTDGYSEKILILLKNYYKIAFKGKTLRKEAKKAFRHIECDDRSDSDLSRYYITFHKTRILVSGSFDQLTRLEGKPTTKDLLESAFYKMLLKIE